MSLETHIPHIEHFHQLLQKEDLINPVQIHVLDMLKHLQGSSGTFDLTACKQTPFYEEFLTTIQGQCIHEDTCFALLECLIIFCREKQLRNGQKGDLPLPEQNILDFYEKSEHWSLSDGTLLHTWYWYRLPEECAKN